MPEGKPLSKEAIRKLGDRLRAGPPTVDDLRLLEAWRSEHTTAQQTVAHSLRDLGLRPVARPGKTTAAIVDKLRRESMRLPQMEDLAGVRVTIDGGRLDQDETVSRICKVLPDTKLRDRRSSPSHGYRAVHIIAVADGHFVEIQVRTRWQNQWAQIMERLADLWGRQIRYGGLPDCPDAPVGSAPADLEYTRERVTAAVKQLADAISQAEAADVSLISSHERMAAMRDTLGFAHGVVASVLRPRRYFLLRRSIKRDLRRLERAATSSRAEIEDALNQLARIFGVAAAD